MKKHLVTACLYTAITAIGLGVVYPVAITGIASLLFRDKADGQLVIRHGELAGSQIIGQPFSGPGYFHGRPSAAGSGYDASASSGSNLGPTSKVLADRVQGSIKSEGGASDVPIDLVTASGSGLDPDITPESAMYQVDRVARERNITPTAVAKLVQQSIIPRQFGLLGEPRVNVLMLNLALSNIGTLPH
jgi:K+-transporting ATPase ATPase C chain